MPQLREPAAAIVTEVYDALVAAGVPDREARKAAEAVAFRGGSADGALLDAGAAVEIWKTLIGVETAAADRLHWLRAFGSALVAGLVAFAVTVFAAFPDARLLVGPYPAHASLAPLALALVLVAQLAARDRRERRLLAAAGDAGVRFEARRVPNLPTRGAAGLEGAGDRGAARRLAGLGMGLVYLAEAAIVCALAFALIEA